MPWSSPHGEVRLRKGNEVTKECKNKQERTRREDGKPGMTVFCIWGSQCALCPWVGSGTLLHLSPRPAVNLKWRRAEEQRLEGEWHIAVSPSCSGYLYSHCPTMTLHPFPSASLIRILHQPSHCLPTLSGERCSRSCVWGAGSLSKKNPVHSRKVWRRLTGTEGAGFTRPLWSNTHKCISVGVVLGSTFILHAAVRF